MAGNIKSKLVTLPASLRAAVMTSGVRYDLTIPRGAHMLRVHYDEAGRPIKVLLGGFEIEGKRASKLGLLAMMEGPAAVESRSRRKQSKAQASGQQDS